MDFHAFTHVEKRARLIEKPIHAAAPRQFGGRRALDGERNRLELCVHTNDRVRLLGGRLSVRSLSVLSPRYALETKPTPSQNRSVYMTGEKVSRRFPRLRLRRLYGVLRDDESQCRIL